MPPAGRVHDNGGGPAAQSAPRERFYALDFLRFAAALAVVFFHLTYEAGTWSLGGTPLYPMLAAVFQYGYLGVDIFFMISGFVILLSASGRSPGAFAISRITRLYPAYWLATALIFVLVLTWRTPGQPVSGVEFLINLTMLQDWLGARHVSSVYWTLVIELQFYILVFILILSDQVKNIERMFSAWLAISFLFDLLFFKFNLFNYISFIKDFSIFYWCSYFIAGAMFYLIHARGYSALRLSLLGLSYLQILLHAYWYMRLKETRFGFEHDFMVVAFIITAAFVFFWLVSRFRISKSFRTLATLGVLTYPLYLTHRELGSGLVMEFAGRYDKYAVLGITVAGLILLAFLIHRYFERPVAPILRASLERLIRVPKNEHELTKIPTA